MMPRVTAPATVRVTGDFIICSKVLGGCFVARAAGCTGAGAGAHCVPGSPVACCAA